jgi:hypothetical protein
VIVSGQLVKRDNKATDIFPGVAIRFPAEEKARFVPANKDQWLNTFSIDSSMLVPR